MNMRIEHIFQEVEGCVSAKDIDSGPRDVKKNLGSYEGSQNYCELSSEVHIEIDRMLLAGFSRVMLRIARFLTII
jgi:hypothetical protein